MRSMISIKTRLVVGLIVVLSMAVAMAGVLYFGARSLEQNATRTREGNDEVRDLFSFALAAHRYVSAFGQSLGQRTLVANNERRVAAKLFEERMTNIPKHNAEGGSGLPWDALLAISGNLADELNVADARRSEGKFYEAEQAFNRARKTQFEQRMLPWFEAAISAQRAQVDAAESKASDEARTLRMAGNVLAVFVAILSVMAIAGMTRAVIRPIRLVVEGADAIATGDLAHRISYRGADELGVLAERFNDMAEVVEASRAELIEKNTALERAYQLQSDFLSIVSHELRSPLNSVIGYTELIIEDSHELPAVSIENVFSIATCARRLLALINDILDFSKLRAGRMQLRRDSFEASNLAALVVEEGKALAHGRAVRVELAAGNPVVDMHSDEIKVRQILTNLISNAVKFTAQGRVTLGVAPAGDRAVCFSVTDSGVGIAAHQLDMIFEPFRQAHGSDRLAVSGTGLGLAIVKHLTDLLGGTVSVRSVVGQGSEFMVTLPTQASE